MTTTIAPTAHSHSRLTVFSQCPLSYKLTYIEKVPQDSSAALEIGAAAHEFFDQWVSKKRESEKAKRDPEVVMVLDGDSEEEIAEIAAKCFQKDARNQSNFKEYLEICQIFAKEYKPDPNYLVVITEKQAAFNRQWEPCDWFAKEVMFRAKIDRIDEPVKDVNQKDGSHIKKVRITDYKTGFSGAPNSFQLDVYALVASLLYPCLEQVEVQFYYVKSGFKQVKLLEVKDMDITKIQIEALIARIEGETKWKPKPGYKCLNCSVAAHCTTKPSDLKAITSPEVASTLGTEISLLEAQAKAKKKALNAYCRQNGPVEAGGATWNHWPHESLVVEMAPLLTACVSNSVDPGTLLNPDSKAIKKVFKENPAFAAAIEPHISVDISMRFYAKRSEANDE